MEAKINEICKRLEKERIFFLKDEPMKNHTSFRIGGEVPILAEPEKEEDILFLKELCERFCVPSYIIGNGSNLLVSDKGYSGVVVKLGKRFSNITVSENRICAKAGALLGTIAKLAAENGLSGFECESGIPGSLGGAVVMNAGAYGGEIKDIVVKTTYISEEGEIKSVFGKEHEFGYRKSFFQKNGATVLSSEMELEYKNKEEIYEKMGELNRKRKEKQPLEYPSCGSTFKRPEGYFAAALIQDANLKGYSIGGAQVSEKHSGFIINTGNATADDVIRLVCHIKEVVCKKFGVELECEMKMLGF